MPEGPSSSTHRLIRDPLVSRQRLILLTPARHELMRYPEMIQYAGNHKIHHILHSLGMVIKAGIGRQDNYAAARKFQHIFQMDSGKRRFAWNKDEFSILFQHYVR